MTDISVNRVENGQELLSGTIYGESDENVVDPLAIPDAVKTEVEEKEHEDVKEESPVVSQNGKDTEDTTVLDKLDETCETNLLKEEPILIKKLHTQDTNILDSNAPTPDLPDHMLSEPEPEDLNNSDTILQTQIGEISSNILETRTQIDLIDEIQDNLNNDKSPELPTAPKVTLISETASTLKDILNSETVSTLKDILNSATISKPIEDSTDETKQEKESIEISTENNVKMLEPSLSITVEERVKTLFHNELLDKIEIAAQKTEIIPEKNQTLPGKTDKQVLKIDVVSEKTIEKVVAEVVEKSKVVQEIIPEPIVISIKTNLEPEKITTEEVKENNKVAVEIEENSHKIQERNNKITKNTDMPVDKISVSKDIEENLASNIEKVKSVLEKMDVDIEKNIPEDAKVERKIELKINKSLQAAMNGDVIKNEQPTKRRASDDIEESPLKRLCQEVEKTFPQHEQMISEYIQSTTKNNIDEIQKHTEHLLAEIQTLRELAQKKEQEWNNILHLKKVKEEILLRLLRRKQVLSFEKSAEMNGSTSERGDPFDFFNHSKNLAIDKSDEISGLSLKQHSCPTGHRKSVSPINPLQNMQNALPVLSVQHFNPMAGLPPPYDKAAAVHMQNMANNIQNMQNNIHNLTNNMQNLPNSMQNLQNMPNNMLNLPNNMQNLPNSMQNMANNMQNMQKPVYQPMMLPGPMQGFPRDINAMNGQIPSNFGMPMGRQGPTKDVKSIIADYRQRNPDVTPRRGRRMKSILNPNMMNTPRNMGPKDGMNNTNNMNMLFNNLDMVSALQNQKAMLERLQQMQGGSLQNSIFKDALVQFANMQNMHQANAGIIPTSRPEAATRPEHHPKERRRPESSRTHEEHKQPERLPSSSPRLPPPPYPEISLLPVSTAQDTNQTQSLLHGILTKNCGEITITPVQPQPEPQPEKPDVVQLDDEESPPASEPERVGSPANRLVIDETAASPDAPLCQGCKRRDAQFVCAGCANQWYCSRECQVAAWDDHSEMCSG